MKRLIQLFVMLAFISANAQIKSVDKTVQPAFIKAVEMVLGDFPYNYNHITGELLLAQGEFEQYASIVTLPGAESCLIGRYHSEVDTTASWQALMYNSEDFDQAAAHYRQLFYQLKSCHLKMSDGSVYYLDGKYETPSYDMPFTTSALTVQTADERYKEFKVEVELVYQVEKWIVNINMVSKKKDDEMRPTLAVTQ